VLRWQVPRRNALIAVVETRCWAEQALVPVPDVAPPSPEEEERTSGEACRSRGDIPLVGLVETSDDPLGQGRQRVKFLTGGESDEVCLDPFDVPRGSTFEEVAATRGDPHDHAASVDGQVLALDEASVFHPPQLVGDSAAIPPRRDGQVPWPQALTRRGQGSQELVVRTRDPHTGQLTFHAGPERAPEVEEGPPGLLVAFVQPTELQGDETLPRMSVDASA